MGSRDFRRELIRAANLEPFNLNATEVADLLNWFEALPGEIFNDLLRREADFPKDYIEFWNEHKENRDEEDE